MARKKIGQLLREQNLISEQDLKKALLLQKTTKKRLGEILVDLKYVTEEDISKTIVSQSSFELVRIDNTTINPEILDLVPREAAEKYFCIPLKLEERKLTVAMSDPLNYSHVRDIEIITGKYVEPVFATKKNINNSIERYYKTSEYEKMLRKEEENKTTTSFEQLTEDETAEVETKDFEVEAPVVRMEKLIFTEALNEGASDIHIEPQRNFIQVRNRIDGALKNSIQIPKWMQNALAIRLKIMCEMDIAQKRVPQDGKRHYNLDGREIDMRISTLPTKAGEKIVIRLLDTAKNLLSFEELGFSEEGLSQINSLIYNRQGLILVVGPTGSGKTTTLYSIVKKLQSESINIITIEDPIEYELEGINQVQVHREAGLTFAKTLKAVLRQDPDIILLGEIRDAEAAEIAFKAALTGHLVLSTIHTPDTVGSLTRLFDLGVNPLIVSDALLGIVAQRLARLNCKYCKEEFPPPPEIISRMKMENMKLETSYRSKGCEHCDFTGYKGRIGIFEIMIIDNKMQQIISKQADSYAVKQMAMTQGMTTLQNSGVQLVLEGKITLEVLFELVYDSRISHIPFCPRCKKSLGPDFKVCPCCMQILTFNCEKCSRNLQVDWLICPYCAHQNESFREKHMENSKEPEGNTEGLVYLKKK